MPNQAHIHLLVNHFPVIGLTFSLLVALYALIRCSSEGMRISWMIMIISSLMAVPAYLTGGPAAHVLKKIPDFAFDPVGPHADMAEIGLFIGIIGAMLALIALVISYLKDKVAMPLKIVVFIFQLASVGIFAYASHLGALVRHTEIQPEGTVLLADPEAPASDQVSPEPTSEK